MRFSSLNKTPYESRRIGPCTLLLKSMPRLPWVLLTSTINGGEAHAVLSAIIIGGRQTIDPETRAVQLGLDDNPPVDCCRCVSWCMNCT